MQGTLTRTLQVGDSSIGKIVVDETGLTLYALDEDTATATACTADCTSVWIPLTVDHAADLTASTSLDRQHAVLRGPNGIQVVYAGHPLFRFNADQAPGDVNGQGVEGKWHVISPKGRVVTKGVARTALRARSR